MRSFVIPIVVVLCTVPLVGTSRGDVDAESVTEAIDRGVRFLLREQKRNGGWSERAPFDGGISALCTLALINGGVPADDARLKNALDYLRKIELERTYVVALQTMVFCAAEPDKDRLLIQRNVKWLERYQIKGGKTGEGGWSYPGADADNSNTQFALLALHEAERVGVPVGENTWRRALGYFQRNQNKNDGSWGYKPGQTMGTGSMTCAGITSLVIASAQLSQGDARIGEDQLHCCGAQQENKALENALAWLGRNFSVAQNPGKGPHHHYYYLYGVERVGRMTARRFLGKHDWYREGADWLLRQQQKTPGSWTGAEGPLENDPRVATSMAILFLSKGRRPVVAAKLKHGSDSNWNHHRGDLAHLTAYAEQKWKLDLTWQVIDANAAAVDDLLQAPVLLITGSKRPEFSRDQVRMLRDYLDRGGFLFAVACCQSDGFDQGFRELMEDVFQEPEYPLRLIPPEHPVWHAEERVDSDYLSPLWGIDYGCRTCVVYCPDDLSCAWEVASVHRERDVPQTLRDQIDAAKAIGVNVLTYATNREPKSKDVIARQIASELPTEGTNRGVLRAARLQHPGGCNAAPGALVHLLRTAHQELGIPVDLQDRRLALTDDRLFDHAIVFMHGRSHFRLTSRERKALRTYVDRGGILIADAICSSSAFADSFRAEMQATFPDRPLGPIPSDHPMLTSEYGGYNITTVTRRDPRRRGKGQPLQAHRRRVAPALFGIEWDEEYRVLFSRYDISCALEKHASLECQGYTNEDARRIALNLLLYGLQ